MGGKVGRNPTPLIERMRKKKTFPRRWIDEVQFLLNEIIELKRERDEYLAIIDNMATELEDFRTVPIVHDTALDRLIDKGHIDDTPEEWER